MADQHMRIYLDHNATTPVDAAAADAMMRALQDLFGNASSVHYYGQQAKAALDDARSAVAALIGAEPSEVIFTSGGTEADNFAIRGAAEALEVTGRKHLITSGIEHEAVINTFKALARRGWKTTMLPLDATGIVSPDRLARRDHRTRRRSCRSCMPTTKSARFSQLPSSRRSRTPTARCFTPTPCRPRARFR